MERTTTAVALAIAMSLTAALSAVPVQAVDADCTKDFDIADSETLSLERSLTPGENETGLEDVSNGDGDIDVTVRLESDSSELEFAVFEPDNGCDYATHVQQNKCESEIVLDTTDPTQDEDEETCTLLEPDDGTREFYFVMENIGDVDLDYRIFVK